MDTSLVTMSVTEECTLNEFVVSVLNPLISFLTPPPSPRYLSSQPTDIFSQPPTSPYYLHGEWQ